MRRSTLRKLIPLFIAAALFWAYHNSFSVPFLLDDHIAIQENPNIRKLWPIWTAMTGPPDVEPVVQRPLLSLSLALNYAFGGLRVSGYHLFNWVIHLLAAFTLLGVIRRSLLLERLKPRYNQTALGLAFTATLLWMLHPLQTESVTYVIQRAEAMMGLFYLMTFYGFLRSIETPRRRWWTWVTVISCALGMGSKQTMVTAPLMVLAFDRLLIASSFKEALKDRFKLYAGLASTWALLALFVLLGPRIESAGFGFEELSFLDNLKTQCQIVVHYLALSFWPNSLVFYYDWPIARSLLDVWPSALLFAALLGATCWAYRRGLASGFLGVWFLGLLAPTTLLPMLGELAAEHRIYLSLAAVTTGVTVGSWNLLERFISSARLKQWLFIGLVTGGVITLSQLTLQRNADYQSALTIWQDTVTKQPHNSRALNNLGVALWQKRPTTETAVYFRKAAQINPHYADPHYNLGRIASGQGRWEEAIRHYRKALSIESDSAKVHNNLGNVLGLLGQTQEAHDHYEQAIQSKPYFAQAYYNLGILLEQQGQLDQAILHYTQAIQLEPHNADAYNNLGNSLAKQGKHHEAALQYKKGLELQPDHAKMRRNLGRALLKIGFPELALRHLSEALRLNPEDKELAQFLERIQKKQPTE